MNKNIKPILGKTIQSISQRAINAWKVRFTDGSYIELWAECDGPLGLAQLYVDAFTEPRKKNEKRKTSNSSVRT